MNTTVLPLKDENNSIIFTIHDWNREMANERILNSIILCLYIFIGVVGNLLVIFVYRSRVTMKQDNRYFILFLAELDLGAVVLSGTYTLFLNFYYVLPKGGWVCKIFSFFSQTAAVTSGIVLLYIAVQRYKLVCRPTKKQITSLHRKLMLVMGLVLGSILSLPILAFYGESEIHDNLRNVTGYQCGQATPTKVYTVMYSVYNGLLFLATIAILISMTVLYTFILKSMKQRSATFKKRQETRKRIQEMADANTGDLDISDDGLIESSLVQTNDSSLGQTNDSFGQTSDSNEIQNYSFNTTNLTENGKDKHPRSSMLIKLEEPRSRRSYIDSNTSANSKRSSTIDPTANAYTKRTSYAERKTSANSKRSSTIDPTANAYTKRTSDAERKTSANSKRSSCIDTPVDSVSKRNSSVEKRKSTTNRLSLACDSSSNGSKRYSGVDNKSALKRGSLHGAQKPKSKAVKNHFSTHRYSYIFISISVFFVIAYIPTVIVTGIVSRNKGFWINLPYAKLQIFLILRRMFIINHIVNPVIYGYFDRSFRREVKRMFKKLLCGLVRSDTNSSTEKTSGLHY